MKIRIVGGPGSGKTYLAKRISKKLKIPRYDLDDIFWDNSSVYGKQRNKEEREEIFQKILKEDNWIIEGVYYAWCEESFSKADKILLLKVPRRKYKFRLIKRFIKRKLGYEKGKNETMKSLFALMKWADKYQKENLPEIELIIGNYSEKAIDKTKIDELLRTGQKNGRETY